MSADDHKKTLQQLIPLELSGVFEADLAIEGMALDRADSDVGSMAAEFYPQSTDALLSEWERLFDLQLVSGLSTETRRAILLDQYRDRGGLLPPYFIARAEAMGYQLTIDEGEATPLQAGTARAGKRLENSDNRYVWRLTVATDLWVYLRAGSARAGQPLRTMPSRDLLQFMDDYKPADITIFYL